MGEQVMILKMKGVLNDPSAKNLTGDNKIWPLLIREKNDNLIDRLRLNESKRPGSSGVREALRNSFTKNQSTSMYNHASESFHCAIGPILTLAQVFGLLPLAGIRTSTPAKLQFSKFSFRTLYATLITVLILIMAILSVIHMIRTLNSETFEVHGGIAAATAGAVFYGNTCLATILFFWLSPRWVLLQREWRAMEQYIDSNKAERPRLRWKFFFITIIVLLVALAEHILSVLNNSEDFIWADDRNKTFAGFIEVYTQNSHAFILDIIQYNILLGIYIFIVSKLATFTWNFMDVFIMLVATGLAERYKSLNRKIANAVVNNRGGVDWCELREDYAALSSVVKKVDEDLSPIILLSFANNLYFICLQLLNGLSRPADSTFVSAFYFFGSFAFLVGRTCLVTLLTARINDQSKVSLPFIYSCSSSNFNIETQRLQYQLTTDDIALTGMRFFYITRNFMLAVAGAIVTYEVVLLQFNVAMKGTDGTNST